MEPFLFAYFVYFIFINSPAILTGRLVLFKETKEIQKLAPLKKRDLERIFIRPFKNKHSNRKHWIAMMPAIRYCASSI